MSASALSKYVLTAHSAIYLVLAVNAIFAPTFQCHLFGGCKKEENLNEMNEHARSLLIMARGFSLWMITIPLSSAIRGKDGESCAVMCLASPVLLLFRALDIFLREIPSATERHMDTTFRFFLLCLAVLMVAVNVYAFAASKMDFRAVVQNPFRGPIQFHKTALLSCAGAGIVMGALARTPLAPSLLTFCGVETFDPIVRAIALVAVRGGGLDLVSAGFLLLVLVSQGHPYSLWVAVRYLCFSAAGALFFFATAKAFVISLGLTGAAMAMRCILALLGGMFLMTLACSITLGDTPPPQTRKAGRPSGSSGARSLRSGDRGKSPTPVSPPQSPEVRARTPRAVSRLSS